MYLTAVWFVLVNMFSPVVAADSGAGLYLSGGDLDSFWSSLSDLETSDRELVRIGWFGDSHTAADGWTGRTRMRFQERFGNGGRGFVWAGKPHKDYRPVGVRADNSDGWVVSNGLYAREEGSKSGRAGWKLFGMSGFSLCTEKKGAEAWLELTGSPVETSGEVYFVEWADGGSLSWSWNDGSFHTIRTKHSGEAGLGIQRFSVDATGSRRLTVKNKRGRNCLLGTVFEGQKGLILDSMGINGARLFTPSRFTDPYFPQMLEDRHYDLIVFAYGTNEASDARFEADKYRASAMAGVEHVRSRSPWSACLVIGPPLFGSKQGDSVVASPNLGAVSQVLADVALANGCGWLDLAGYMGGPASINDWFARGPQVVDRLMEKYGLTLDADYVNKVKTENTPLLAKDVVHYHSAGYVLLGELTYKAIMNSYDLYLSTTKR